MDNCSSSTDVMSDQKKVYHRHCIATLLPFREIKSVDGVVYLGSATPYVWSIKESGVSMWPLDVNDANSLPDCKNRLRTLAYAMHASGYTLDVTVNKWFGLKTQCIGRAFVVGPGSENIALSE